MVSPTVPLAAGAKPAVPAARVPRPRPPLLFPSIPSVVAGTWFSIRVHAEWRLAVVQLAGFVDGEDLVRALQALYRAPAFRPGFHTVWNAHGVQVLDLTPDHVVGLCEAVRDIPRRLLVGRTAVLGRGEHDVTTVRLLTLGRRHARVARVRAFTDGQGAAAWLGVAPGLVCARRGERPEGADSAYE